jgi:hypothetical protein
VGQELRVKNLPCQILGVLAVKGQSPNESIKRRGVRRDKPAWCRGCKSPTGKERATPS